MLIVTLNTVSNLPTGPSTADPANFDSRADAFLAAVPAYQTQMNAVAGQINENTAWTSDKALEAQTAATAAAVAAAASQANANAAATSAGAIAWVSGTTYAIGNARWSPVSRLVYRRITAGAGTIDPSLDISNWERILAPGEAIAFMVAGII